MSLKKLAREEVLGRYRLIARLGRGGMAEVFLARLVGAAGFERLVAVKRMLSSLSGDRTFVAMFLNEGRIAAQLDHPNVCHVYELDEVDGTLFLAMEFLRGLPWSEIAPAIPDRPQATLVRFIAGAIVQACEGLHHAHTAVGADGKPRPIVHRDVSPTNLFVTNDGIVKLLDFGVSKVLTEPTVTASGMIKGKLPYMAPEQLQGRPVDVRADIFSLAVVTWEAFAGRPLFDRKTDDEVRMAVTEGEIPALPGEGPVIKRLDMALRRALARDRTQRHGSARAFADDLRRAIATSGEPMSSSEIRAHVTTWLGPNLVRRSRDLAKLIGRGRQFEDLTGEQTSVHEHTPIAGVRLRDMSVVVGDDKLQFNKDEKINTYRITGDQEPVLSCGLSSRAPQLALDLEDSTSDRLRHVAVPHSGDTVGKYKLGKKLGEGAFGLVFIAHDTGLERDVALKFLHPHQVSNPQVLDRFLQEARSLAKLSHPGIVTIHEFGTASDGTTFIAMELLQGESLRDRLNNVRKFSPDTAKEICRQIAAILQAAHLAGIIHRDLKPDNIFLTVDSTMPGHERVKVLDFGIAKLMHTQTTSVQTGSIIFGTPRYMSPEQCRSSANVDHRTDIYALGCILYELVCGRTPFDGAPGELLAKHQLTAAPPAREFIPDLPHELDRLLSRMLAKEPGQRPQTMARVQSELTGDHPSLAPTLEPGAITPGPITPVPQPIQSRTTLSDSTGSSNAPARTKNTSLVLTTSIVLAGTVAAILIITHTTDLPAIAPPATTPPATAPPAAIETSHVLESIKHDREILVQDPIITDASTASMEEAKTSTTARHLTPDNISAIVRAEYATALRNCYEQYAKSNRDAPRKLVVTLHVALTGRIVEYETSPPMKSCEVFANIRFPPDAAVDDASRRVEAKVTFDYPAMPVRSSVATPARVPHNCPEGTAWQPSESACVAAPPAKKKKCPPIKDRVVDPFEEDPCRQ